MKHIFLTRHGDMSRNFPSPQVVSHACVANPCHLVAIVFGEGPLHKNHRRSDGLIFLNPIGSMYGIFAYIWLIFMVNVGKYTIHGSSGNVHPYLYMGN